MLLSVREAVPPKPTFPRREQGAEVDASPILAASLLAQPWSVARLAPGACAWPTNLWPKDGPWQASQDGLVLQTGNCGSFEKGEREPRLARAVLGPCSLAATSGNSSTYLRNAPQSTEPKYPSMLTFSVLMAKTNRRQNSSRPMFIFT